MDFLVFDVFKELSCGSFAICWRTFLWIFWYVFEELSCGFSSFLSTFLENFFADFPLFFRRFFFEELCGFSSCLLAFGKLSCGLSSCHFGV